MLAIDHVICGNGAFMIRTKKLTKGKMCYTKIFHVAQGRHTVGMSPRRPSKYIPQEVDGDPTKKKFIYF